MGWEITVGDEVWQTDVRDLGGGRFAVTLNGEQVSVDAVFPEPGVVHLVREGEAFELDVLKTDQGRDVTLYGTVYEVGVVDERRKALAALGGLAGGGADGEVVSTSMPGKVVAVLVQEGDAVSAGQGIVVVEAMKMENELSCRADGVVGTVHVAAGDAVEGGAALVTIAPPEASE